jgi:hypothetical protein
MMIVFQRFDLRTKNWSPFTGHIYILLHPHVVLLSGFSYERRSKNAVLCIFVLVFDITMLLCCRCNVEINRKKFRVNSSTIKHVRCSNEHINIRRNQYTPRYPSSTSSFLSMLARLCRRSRPPKLDTERATMSSNLSGGRSYSDPRTTIAYAAIFLYLASMRQVGGGRSFTVFDFL